MIRETREEAGLIVIPETIKEYGYVYRIQKSTKDEKETVKRNMFRVEIKRFDKMDVQKVIEFEKEVRKQEPDTYYWEPDKVYKNQLDNSFEDERFNTAMSFIAVRDNKVIGRIDASVIASRSDAACYSAYLDWICVLKSERHNKVAQSLLNALRAECKKRGIGVLIALMANNNEAQSFYKGIEDASIHDTGIWIDIK